MILKKKLFIGSLIAFIPAIFLLLMSINPWTGDNNTIMGILSIILIFSMPFLGLSLLYDKWFSGWKNYGLTVLTIAALIGSFLGIVYIL